MGPKEESSRIEQRIQQYEPVDPVKATIIGIVGIAVILFLPAIMEWASHERPWRF